LGRSRARGGRPHPVSPAVAPSSIPSLDSATSPRVWQSVGYRALSDGTPLRRLFDFAAASWPGGPLCFAWDACLETDATVIGGLVAERHESAAMLHGPVVASEDAAAAGADRLEIAAQLVAAALEHARALGVRTVYARPQGLDRIWVRFGFIPVPESTLPEGLAGRPGAGLFAWRGGSALWTLRETS
jgi:hypothetical protein